MYNLWGTNPTSPKQSTPVPNSYGKETTMNCPECGEKLEARLNPYNKGEDFVDVDFTCKNNHEYFVRVKEDDLLPANP